MSTSNNPTDKKYEDWETLKKNNPWRDIFKPDKPDTQNLLDSLLNGIDEIEGKFICPGDEDIIRNRNEALKVKGKKDNMFVTSLLPKPYRGNLKDPKLVILSLNPGYNERVKKTLFEMLKKEHQDRFIEITKKNALLEDNCSIIEIAKKEDNCSVKFDDVDVVTDNGYWLDKLYDFINEPGVDVSKIGLIQFIPYASKYYDSWREEAELKSQEFSMNIIRRLLYKDESTLFLVMRAKKQWDKLFKKYKIELDKEEIKKRFLFNKNPICQKITPENLKNDNQYKKIVEHLRNN